MAQLTDLKVKSLKPQNTRYIAWFEDGLGVRVMPSGSKSFFYWYRQGAKKRALTLGQYPHVSVKEALRRHAEARVHRANDIDPASAKAQARRAAKEAGVRAAVEQARRPTVRKVFDRWLELDLRPRTDEEGFRQGRKDGGAAARAQFDLWVFPSLGEMPAHEVSKGDVMEIIDRAKAEGKRRTAGAIFSNLRQMFDFAADREYVDRNPLQTLRKVRIVGRVASRKRVLADWELRRLLQRLPLVDLHPVTVLALQFVLCTGQRPGEVAGMAKAELSADGMLWTIPAERYKTGEVQRVPLSAFAQDLLRQAAALNTSSAFVFPSPQSVGVRLGGAVPEDDACIDRHSLSRAVSRKLGKATAADVEPAKGDLGLDAFVPHDLRRSCRTQLAALGVPEHIAERVIGHKLQGMMAVYNLHDYLTERRDALERWGQHLAALRGV